MTASDAMSPAVQVHLVDLPALYANGLRHALIQAGMPRVSVTALHQLAQEAPARGRFVVVVPQARLGPLSALLQEEIEAARCSVVELAETMSARGFLAAVDRGASGFVEMDGEAETVVDAVRSAARGMFVLPAPARQLLARGHVQEDPPLLSEQELRWLRSLGSGTTVAVLAATFAYSEREMYRLLARLYRTLGAATRTQALLNAQRWGLLDERESR